jgi:hypothetical protein
MALTFFLDAPKAFTSLHKAFTWLHEAFTWLHAKALTVFLDALKEFLGMFDNHPSFPSPYIFLLLLKNVNFKTF